jgi:hypothetical protein
MKKSVLIFAIIIISALTLNAKEPVYHHRIGFNYFYLSLESHGRWIEYNDGLVVWKPYIRFNNWAPYTRGGWIYTNSGWYWDSYEPFGHIVYHYGRWHYDDYYGWIWIPDYEWAPSWVEWRYDDDYIGWAPLPPYAHFSITIGITFTRHYSFGYHHWHFVKYRNFCDPYIYNHFAPTTVKYRLYSNTKMRNDYGYERNIVTNRGLDRNTIENRGGFKIRETNLVLRERDNNTTDNIIKSKDRIEVLTPREDQVKDNTKEIKIERDKRNSSLERTKVVSNERINQEVSTLRDRNRIEEKTKTNTTERRDVTSDTRKMESPNEVKNRTNETKREETRNNNSNTWQNNNPPREQRNTEQNREVNREQTQTNNNNVFRQRENNTERRTNTNTEIQKETSPRIQNNENRNERRQETIQDNTERSRDNNNNNQQRENRRR